MTSRSSSKMTDQDITAALETGSVESPLRRSSRSSKKTDQEKGVTESPKVVTPRRTSKSSKKTEIASENIETKTPTTPEKASSLPKHITPLKHATPLKDDLSKTPTRRTRRASSSEVTSGEPLTPVRRSRRLSGVAADLSAAPDGGIITGATPRRTPRGKRHNTSVQAEDVEAALAIAGVSQLPTLIEEEADSKAEEAEEVPDQEISVTKRR